MGKEDSRRLLRTEGVYVHTLLLKMLLLSFAEKAHRSPGSNAGVAECWKGIAAGLPVSGVPTARVGGRRSRHQAHTPGHDSAGGFICKTGKPYIAKPH